MTIIIVPGVPVAQPRPRATVIAGRAHVYNPAGKSRTYRERVALCAIGHTQIEGPIELTVRFYWPRPKHLMWKTRPMPRLAKATKPDLDNVLKALKDSLTGIMWSDDAQVVKVHAEKWYCAGNEVERTEIDVRAMEAA